jgi:hypothetical protein
MGETPGWLGPHNRSSAFLYCLINKGMPVKHRTHAGDKEVPGLDFPGIQTYPGYLSFRFPGSLQDSDLGDQFLKRSLYPQIHQLSPTRYIAIRNISEPYRISGW